MNKILLGNCLVTINILFTIIMPLAGQKKEESSMGKSVAKLMVVMVIFLAIFGCGNDGKNIADTGGGTPVNVKASQGKDDSENSSGLQGGVVKSGKNMEVPAGFPTDILPLLEDAQIDNVIKNDTNKAINVNFTTKKSLKEATEFYKEVMKGGSNIQKINSGDTNIIMGAKGNYVITITIMASQEVTIVNIDTRPEV